MSVPRNSLGVFPSRPIWTIPCFAWIAIRGVAHLGIGRELTRNALGIVWQMTTTPAMSVTAPGVLGYRYLFRAADWWRCKYPYLGLPLQGCIMRRGDPSQRFIPCASTSTAYLCHHPSSYLLSITQWASGCPGRTKYIPHRTDPLIAAYLSCAEQQQHDADHKDHSGSSSLPTSTWS